MKLEIFGDPSREVVRLRLVEDDDGEVSVCAVRANGECVDYGVLLSFAEDGRMRREVRISPDLGFDLDDYGRIKLVE